MKRSTVARVLVGFVLAFTTGCYRWEAVKPTELPKLNGGAVAAGTVASGTNRGEVIAVSVAHVERPDGTLMEIEGEFDVRVTRNDGLQVEFEHPVESKVNGDLLGIRAANHGKTRFLLREVKEVEVSQYDGTVGWLVFNGILAVGLGIALAITL